MGIHPPKAIPRLMFVHSKIRFQRQIRFYEHFKRSQNRYNKAHLLS